MSADQISRLTALIGDLSAVPSTPPDALAAVLAKAQQTTPQPQRIARRNVPTIVSAAPTGGPAPFAGQASRASYGPFVDALGRNAWIDVFEVLSLVGIQRAGTAAAIYIAITGATEAADHINLGAGSVWIATSALVAGARIRPLQKLSLLFRKLRLVILFTSRRCRELTRCWKTSSLSIGLLI